MTFARQDIYRLASLYIVGLASAIFVAFQPSLVSSYVDRLGMSEGYAGSLLSLELVGATIGTLFVFLKGVELNRRKLALAALFILALSNGASLILTSAAPLAALRFLAGFGGGVATGIFASCLALEQNTERHFGAFSVIVLLSAAFSYQVLPLFSDTAIGVPAFFLLMLFASIAIPFTKFFPKGAERSSPTAAGEGQSNNAAASAAWPAIKVTAPVVVCATSFFLVVGGLWPFLGQIGLNKFQLTEASLNSALASTQYSGAAGAMIALILANRLGHIAPLTTSMIIATGSLLMLVGGREDDALFIVAAQLFMFSWLLFFPYFMGLAAELDPFGRLASMVYFIQTAASVVGPALAALLVGALGYNALIVMGACGFAFTLMILGPATYYLQRRTLAARITNR